MALPVTLVKADDCQQNWEATQKLNTDTAAAIAAAVAAVAAAAPQPGDLKATATATAAGWLLCDGTSYLRTAWPALFTAIGTAFGAVDGTHFTVPNLLGRVPMGAGTAAGATGATAHALGTSGGEETHLLAATESGVPVHGHAVTDPTHFHSFKSGEQAVNITTLGLTLGGTNLSMITGPVDTTTAAASTGLTVQNAAAAAAAAGHNNLQPFQAVNWWIKT